MDSKIHKEGVHLRPIVSNIGSVTCKLSKYLAGIFRPFVGHSVDQLMNSVEFVHTLGSLQVRLEDLIVSFSVASLFTQVPLVESLNLLNQHISEDIVALFRHALTCTYLFVGGQFCKQTDGVGIGSLLCPVIADFLMEDFEERA